MAKQPERHVDRTWLNEFGPDYAIPVEILNLVRAGKLADQSWHNDACPSFAIAEGVTLWVAHPAPDSRAGQAKRFGVALYDEDGAHLSDAIETDDLKELLHYLADHWDVRPGAA